MILVNVFCILVGVLVMEVSSFLVCVLDVGLFVILVVIDISFGIEMVMCVMIRG